MKIINFLLGLALLTSCSKNTDESKISFTLHYLTSNNFSNSEININFDDGKTEYILTNNDFSNGNSSEFSTETSGNIDIRFSILDSLTDTISTGSINLPIKSDWSWGVGLYITDSNPYNTCMGCTSSKSFILNESYVDSLYDSVFVVWGGNSIKNPVVY